MLTQKLWRALEYTAPMRQNRRLFQINATRMPWYGELIVSVSTLFIFPMILFTGAVHSVTWIVQISSALAAQRRRNLYDMLALTPSGALGTAWVLGATMMKPRVHHISSIQALVVRVLIMGLFFGTFCGAVTYATTQDVVAPALGLLTLPLWIVCAGVVNYTDHYHSILTGTLLAMLAPTYSAARSDPTVVALGLYFVVQFGLYFAALLLLFVLLALPYGVLIAPVICTAGLYAVREAFIGWLWRTLLQRLNAGEDEAQAILNTTKPRLRG